MAIVRANVRLNVYESDAKLRIMRLFTDYRTLLRSCQWEGIITENPKMAIGHIVMLLQPTKLKNTVENALKVSHFSPKKDWKGFYKYLLERAVSCEDFVPLYKPKSYERNNDTNMSFTTSSASTGAKGTLKDKQLKQKSALSTTSEATTTNPVKGDASSKGTKPKCLNPNCTGHHFL